MRVLQVISQDRGGPVDHAVDVAVELAALGHDSHLAGPPGRYTGRLAGAGVAWHQITLRHKADLAGLRSLTGLIRSVRPDVLHLQDRRAGLHGRLVARALRVPGVYTLHGVADSVAHLVAGNQPVAGAGTRGGARTRPERVIARMAPGTVVTPCAALADYVIHHVRVPARRVSVVPNGVGPQWLSCEPRPARRDAVTVAWLGVMQPVKRLPALIRAVAELPAARLLLIGDGPERALAERTIADCGARERMEITGFVDDPRSLLAQADVFALPSAAEACPLALLQAMASGLPVLASAAGGIPEIVRDGVDGLLVPTGDDAALGGALARLAADADLRNALATAARQRVAADFTARRCAQGLLAVYAEAIT